MIVYRHIRLDTNETFYIGIGKQVKRAYINYGRNNHWHNLTKKVDYRVEILFENLTFDEANQKEIELIKLYGRRDLGLGPLVNLNDGGGANTGYIMSNEQRLKIGIGNKNKIVSEETKNKISLGNTGKIRNELCKLKMSKAKENMSDEVRKKYSDMRKGKKASDETKKKMSEARKGHKMPTSTCNICNKTYATHIIIRWHNKNCKLKSN